MSNTANIQIREKERGFPTDKFRSIETPFYYYNTELLEKTLELLIEQSSRYGYHVHYALKANTNDKILNIIKKYGLGADCVSGNEVKKAVESGFPANKIVFAGVGKSDKEINYALDHEIFSFNCESLQELEVLNELAGKKGTTASVALRINPNVNANTHKYITTGLEENKFGINTWELDSVYELIKQSGNLNLIGLHFHIGSQINDLSAFKSLCVRVNEIVKWFEDRAIPIVHLNMGGGLGVDYTQPDAKSIPDFEEYFRIFHTFLEQKPGQQVHFELGRSIIAQCGNLISRVLYIKKGVQTNFVILDAGMTELIRPALYQAYHKIENISRPVAEFSIPDSGLTLQRPGTLNHSEVLPLSAPLHTDHSAMLKYDVVGPICESSDCFGKAVLLPETSRGDLVAIRSTGAYGEVMTSAYNLRDKAIAVYSNEI